MGLQSALHSATCQCIYRVQRVSQSLLNFFFHFATALRGPGPPHYTGFTITLSYTHHS